MAEKMTPREAACAQLDPCPFCGHDLHADDPFDVLYPVTRDGKVWGVHCTVSNGGCDASMLCDGVDSAAAAWNRRAHLAQPAQAVEVGLVERLRKRAAEERQIAENNARVAEMLAPELARFNVRDAHNIYATRMAIDHRDSAKRDAAFADDLEAAVVAITRAIGNAQAEAALDWNSESTKPSDDPMNASNGE